MKYLAALLFIIFTVHSTTTFAQENTGRIVGTVTSENQKTLEAATVTLLNYKDSAIVKMGVSDQSGTFTFEDVAEVKYFVLVSTVGYEPRYTPLEVSTDARNVILKTIQLRPNAVA